MYLNHSSKSNKLSRRTFLKATSLSGLGFAIGAISLPFSASAAEQTAINPDNFVKIGKDNLVTVVIKHLDKGQGVTTGLTAIVADELDADWGQMRWEFAPSDPARYNNLFWGAFQGTGGSTSIANSWMQLRQAGAAAKHMLKQAAANKWGVRVEEIKVTKGMLTHASGKKASFGDMAILAARVTPPAEPKLKQPNEFTIIGRQLPRIDSPEKCSGKADYTLDVKLADMQRAVMLHPPRFGGKLKSVNDKQALKIEGVNRVASTPRGVVVIADNYWSASQGRDALQVEWDDSNAEKRSSDQLLKEYKALVEKDGIVVRDDGDLATAFKQAETTIELDFEFPFLAHAAMEPMNCAMQMKNGQCHIYTGSQTPGIDQGVASQVLGLPPEKVFIHTQFAGGSFGRRAVPDGDFVMDAAFALKALGADAAVNMQWSRENDMKGGRYRPMAVHRLKAAIDAKGNLSGWHHRVVSQSILRGTPFAGMIQGEIDTIIFEGGATLPYAIPNLRVDGHETNIGIPVLWWRSVGHTFNAYATEVFLDEVAHKLKKDPVEFRLALLKNHPRHVGVLKLAAEKADWGKKLPANKAQGVAVHESFNSFVAQVAEVTLNEDGTYHVDKIVCAVDCGVAITPDVIKAQMEGGIGFGLGSSMREKITFKDGKVEQNNFYDYFPLRITDMPEIEVHIVNSNEAPTGVGEPGTPPAGPAVANALCRLSGKALTQLPIGDRLV